MEALCPECMGALDTSNGSTAHCTLHGGTFRILYARRTASPSPPPLKTAPATVRCPHCAQEFSASAEHFGMAMECTNCQREFRVALAPPLLTCSRHGSIPATTVCNRCGTYLCATCAFPDKRSGSLCPSCAAVPVAAQPRQTGLAPRQCAMHPAMRAVGSCSGCGVAVCGTCAFDFPGGVRLCPRCAASPQKGLSAKRKKALVWSYVLAVWTTLGLAVLLSGVLASSLQSKSDVEVLGMVLMIVIFAPSIIGTAMGFSAMDRRLSNPAAVWIAIVWNGIILAVLLLLTIIGNLSG